MGRSTGLLLGLALALLAGAAAWWLAREDTGAGPAAPIAVDAPTPRAVVEPEPTAAVDAPPRAEPPRARAALESDLVVRGVVVHAEDGAPFPGVRVRLTSFRDTRAEAETDAAGAFTLPWVDAKARAVEVEPPAGFFTSDHRQRLRGDEPGAPLRFELQRRLGEPVAVRVVDAFDGEPLAELEVELHGPRAARRRTTTDGQGVARLDEVWESGDAFLYTVSEDGATEFDSQVEFTLTSGLQDVRLPMGPTLTLDLRAPPGCPGEGFVARLQQREGMSWFENDGGRPLRAGPLPWVRFSRRDVQRAGDTLPRLLVVVSEDGLWAGSAPVEASAGRVAEPVVVALEAFGAVHYRALDAEGRALREAGAVLEGRPADAPAFERVRARDDGSGTFLAVAPGTRRLRVRAEGHVSATAEVQVEAGRTTEVELRLERAPERAGGSVSGTVVSSSGRARVANQVTLVDRERHGEFLVAEVRWSTDEDPPVGRFDFRNVPAGTWTLSPDPAPPGLTWQPESRTVEPPASGLVFTLQDSGPLASLEVDVFERGTGKPIQGGDLKVGLEFDGSSSYNTLGGNRLFADDLRTDLDLRWHVSAPGYVSAHGRLADLAAVEVPGKRTVLRARVELERGWDVTLLAWSGDAQGIGGARVFLDGVEVGVTDERGELRLRRETLPGLLRIEADGWRVVELVGTFDLMGRHDTWDGPKFLPVHLERP